MRNEIEQFKDAIQSAGLEPPDVIEPDGKLRRFASNGKRGDDSGWYVLHDDGIPAGAFGDWRTGTSQTWRADIGRKLTSAEEAAHKARVESMRRQREAEEAKLKAEAASKALAIWTAAEPEIGDHKYLARKDVKAYGLRLYRGGLVIDGMPCDGCLIVPARDGSGVIHTLQFIHPERRDGDNKRFLPGGAKSGYYHSIGKPNSVLCIAEGYATADSVHEATGHAAAVAFDAGNLKPVAKALRAKFPDIKIIVCADDDHRTEGNPGMTKAREAALVVGGLLAVPDFGDNRPEGASDFNDLAQHRGLKAVELAIANAQAPVVGKHQSGTENSSAGAGDAGKFDKESIEKLAKLSPFDYDRAREAEAARLEVRVSTLDAEVRKARGEPVDDAAQGQAFVIESQEPWPDPVDGVELLNDIAATYRRYVVLLKHAVVALALWTMHTYTYNCGRCTPILALTSPQKRCGKTTLLSVLLSLANKPLGASNISPSCVYRSIDRWRPTLLIDEADSFFKKNEELRGIIDSGHTRELAYVIRNVRDDHEPRQFSTWCPKAIALIGKLPQTLHDRAIEIPLARKTAVEPVQRLKEFDGTDIRRKCARWVADNASKLHEADPEVPPELHDRAADNWRPLLAIADQVGDGWPESARTAAKALAERDDDTESYAVMLLADIRDLFKEHKTDKLFSEEIVEHLHTLEDRPWPQWGRSQKPITKNQVARLLKLFKIKPGQLWNGKNERGYELKQFTDAFSRYLPPFQTARPLDASSGAASGENQTASGKEFLADGNSPKPKPGAGSSGLADENTPVEGNKGVARDRGVI